MRNLTMKDKRFEKDYIRRWRVLAMLTNIKRHIVNEDDDILKMIDGYIGFAEKIDEDEWGFKEKQ